jgi:hypothetical protein
MKDYHSVVSRFPSERETQVSCSHRSGYNCFNLWVLEIKHSENAIISIFMTQCLFHCAHLLSTNNCCLQDSAPESELLTVLFQLHRLYSVK